MLRLLGILTIVNWLFGGHHHRRSLRRGILFGAILGFFAHRNFDTEHAAGEVRERTQRSRETIRETVREVKQEIRDAQKEIRESQKADREVREAGREARQDEAVIPVREASAEAAANESLVEDLEQYARTAAMMSDVPVIHFPEEDPKYNSSKKYGYV